MMSDRRSSPGRWCFPAADARTILKRFDALMKAAPDELTVWVVIRKASPAPFLPPEWVGKPVLIFSACYAGDMTEGAEVIGKLRALGTPIADNVKPTLWTEWQTAHDAGLTPGFRNYWKSQDIDEISDGRSRCFSIRSTPPPMRIAKSSWPVSAAPWRAFQTKRPPIPHRAAHFIMNVHARWETARQDDECIGWARSSLTTCRNTPSAASM